MSKKKKNLPKTNYEIYQSIRRDWGGFNPVTRIKESNKIYRRARQKDFEDYEEDLFDEEYMEDIDDK